MPVYEYKCPGCGGGEDVFRKLAQIDEPAPCSYCGTSMNRQISAPMVRGDYPGYNCPVSGKWVEGRRAHEENLARTGCRVLESGETENVRRSRAASEAALDRAVEKTAEEFVEKLSGEDRQALGTALESGMDVQLTRT